MTYKITTKVYQGPFDVLLVLLRKHEVDIEDIPISKITRDFLRYITSMKKKDLELSGEFIVVAATLMDIKARMLLPVTDEEAEEPEDPRRELVEKIIEYQYYQQAVERFMEMEKERSFVFGRMGQENQEKIEPYLEETSVYELLKAWQEVAGKVGGLKVTELSRPEYSLARRLEEIEAVLAEERGMGFAEIFPAGSTRIELIISLLALLELARRGRIGIIQDKPFGEIRIVLASARPLPVENERSEEKGEGENKGKKEKGKSAVVASRSLPAIASATAGGRHRAQRARVKGEARRNN